MRTSRCILYTALGTGLCLLYVFMQTEITKLGYRIHSAEKILESCADKKTALEYQLTSLESPVSIDKNLFDKSDAFEMAREYKLVKWVPAESGAASLAGGRARPGSRLFAFSSLFVPRQAEAKTVK